MGSDEARAPGDQNARHSYVSNFPESRQPQRAAYARLEAFHWPTGEAMLHLEPRFKVKAISMRIGELSQRTGASTSRIRFYERHKVLPQPIRDGNGYRTYPDSAAKILGLIDGAQQLGFSLNEIRAALSEAAANFPSRVALVKALRGKLDHIDQHINEVRARRRQILKLLKEMGD